MFSHTSKSENSWKPQVSVSLSLKITAHCTYSLYKLVFISHYCCWHAWKKLSYRKLRGVPGTYKWEGEDTAIWDTGWSCKEHTAQACWFLEMLVDRAVIEGKETELWCWGHQDLSSSQLVRTSAFGNHHTDDTAEKAWMNSSPAASWTCGLTHLFLKYFLGQTQSWYTFQIPSKFNIIVRYQPYLISAQGCHEGCYSYNALSSFHIQQKSDFYFVRKEFKADIGGKIVNGFGLI